MKLWQDRPETRALTGVPWSTGGPTESSVSQDRALHLTPVFAAIRHITDYGSTLPLKSYRKVGDDRIRAPMPRLFSSLMDRGELGSWLSQGLASLTVRGNAVGLITAHGARGVEAVTWISMDRVHVDDVSGVGRWYIDGRYVPRLDLVHIPWITVPGRTLGLSPIEHYAATVNAGLSAQSFGSDWFAGGGFPPAVFQNTQKTLTAKSASIIRARLAASIRSRQPLVTGRDWTYTPVSIPPEQAQFIETQKLSASQVASIYGIDPTEIGGESANSLTYSTEETRQISRAANMRPYLVRFENAWASWLARPQFVSFNTDAVIRVDTKSRHEVYEAARRMGLRSLNEIRALEDLPPIPGGDEYVPTPVQQGTPPAPPVDNQKGSANE